MNIIAFRQGWMAQQNKAYWGFTPGFAVFSKGDTDIRHGHFQTEDQTEWLLSVKIKENEQQTPVSQSHTFVTQPSTSNSTLKGFALL